MPGITTSSSTRSGRSLSTSSSASGPEVAVTTAYPFAPSRSPRSFRLWGVSSTTRIFAGPLTPAPPLPDRRSSSSRTASRNSFTLIGFVWYASNPAAMICWRLCVMADAVTAMTGMARVTGSARRWPSAAMPSMPGSWMSIRTRAGRRSRASRMPSSAVSLSTVW